jgi:predicted O-linked N-acetylglucosamine transferase (SPINDLY family)
VQVSYMGFPATMGAPYMDYLVADQIVLPQAEQHFYDEKIAWLPDTYWVNDAQRAIANETPTRAQCGLADQGFVFCNFNNGYKLTPDGFALWLRILRQVDGSVLWLPEGNNRHFAANLRAAAAAQGVDPARLVFAPLVPSPQHLARLKLADLSLDGLPYNAHTTASDSLWAGVPILTCTGTTWPGRVCASLLLAMEMPELVTDSEAAFEALAVRLAQNPDELAALRVKLVRNRTTTALFDTARFTVNMEAAYRQMWARHQRGEKPESFRV